MTLVDDKELDQAIQELKIKFMPTILDNWKLWPLAIFSILNIIQVNTFFICKFN